jgi:hypothetical protein
MRHEDVWVTGGRDPRILDTGNCWRWVVSFTLRPFYSQGNSRRFPLLRNLDGPQNRYGRRGETNLASTGTRTPALPPFILYPVAIPTELFRLLIWCIHSLLRCVLRKEVKRLYEPKSRFHLGMNAISQAQKSGVDKQTEGQTETDSKATSKAFYF